MIVSKKKIIKFNKKQYLNLFIHFDSHFIFIQGKLGETKRYLSPLFFFRSNNNHFLFMDKQYKCMFLDIINKSICGVTYGEFVELKINGLGIRVSSINNRLILDLGFSHLYEYLINDLVYIKCFKEVISLKSLNFDILSNVSFFLRNSMKVGPYKCKGLIYLGEQIKLKIGKRD